MKNFYLILDKFLALFGQKKSQKGFFVAALTGLVIKFFPDFPEGAFTDLIEKGTLLINILGQMWISIGLLHQWIKDRLVAENIIPPSVKTEAQAGKTIVIVEPKK